MGLKLIVFCGIVMLGSGSWNECLWASERIHSAIVSGVEGDISRGVMVECPDAEVQNAIKDVMNVNVRLSAVGPGNLVWLCFLAAPPE